MRTRSLPKGAAPAPGTRWPLLAFLLVLVGLTPAGFEDAAAQTFENQGCTKVYDNDGGWFGWSQYNVTCCWKVIVDAQPAGTMHFMQTLWEEDGVFDDNLGSKLHCVPRTAWTQRADGRWETTICKTWKQVSTYYGDDWVSTLESVQERRGPETSPLDSSQDPSCGAISTTFWQPTHSGPVMQLITLEEQQCPIIWLQYGAYQSDFSASPIMPGARVQIAYPAQTGTLPYAIGLATGGAEGGQLTGLQDQPTASVGGAGVSWGRVKQIYR